MPISILSTTMTSGRSSLIGVAISLGGNVLISLALNVQKLAHMQLQDEAEGHGGHDDHARRRRRRRGTSHGRMASGGAAAEQEVIPEEEAEDQQDGSSAWQQHGEANERTPLISTNKAKANGHGGHKGNGFAALARDDASDDESRDSDSQSDNGPSAAYLKSKLWWLGMGLMVIGEGGNFLSYGFAPASLVAPLGAVALLSNVLISPLLLKERFRPSDLGGILLSIIGAVTVVFASKADDPSLGPRELWHAIKSRPFEVYAAVALGLASLLVFLSTTRWADRLVLIDVGVCAIFGGFTVLSTKGLSSLISQGKPLELLKLPITYGLAVVLGLTAVAQITFLNRALQRFDSREVIPVQFVLFTLSAIVGSSILYRDFDNVEPHRLINFLFGVLTTFAGVFVLTKQHMRDDGDEDDDEGASDVDEDEAEGAEADASDHGHGEPQTVEDGAAQIRSHLHTAPAKQLLIVEPAGLAVGRRGRDRPTRHSGVTSGSVPTSSGAQQSGQPSTSLTSTYSLGGLSARAAVLAPTRLSFMGNLGPSTRGLSAGTHLLLAATPPPPLAPAASVGGPTGTGPGGLTTFAVARTPAHLRQRSMSQPSTPTRRRSRANMRGSANAQASNSAAAQRSNDSQPSRRTQGSGARGGRTGADEDLERGLRRRGRDDDETDDEELAARRWTTYESSRDGGGAQQDHRHGSDHDQPVTGQAIQQQQQGAHRGPHERNESLDEEMPWASSRADRSNEGE